MNSRKNRNHSVQGIPVGCLLNDKNVTDKSGFLHKWCCERDSECTSICSGRYFQNSFKLLLHIFLYLWGNLCLQAILRVGASTASSSLYFCNSPLCISEVDGKWWGLLCVQNQSKCIFKKEADSESKWKSHFTLCAVKVLFGLQWEWKFLCLFLVTIFNVLSGLFFPSWRGLHVVVSCKPNSASDTHFLINFPTKYILRRVTKV